MMFDLAHDDVTGHYWKGLRRFRLAFSYGEPLAKHPGVGTKIAEWLLERSLIEVVENPHYRKQTCYRVSALGSKVLARGQLARPRPKRPKLPMLKPRIATAPSRFKPSK
jgi:hypothetical protein